MIELEYRYKYRYEIRKEETFLKKKIGKNRSLIKQNLEYDSYFISTLTSPTLVSSIQHS